MAKSKIEQTYLYNISVQWWDAERQLWIFAALGKMEKMTPQRAEEKAKEDLARWRCIDTSYNGMIEGTQQPTSRVRVRKIIKFEDIILN
jgi:hypothetical protein